MDIWQLVLIVGSLLAAATAFIWVAISVGGNNKKEIKSQDDYSELAKNEVERIFNDEFREELRSRGRTNLENIINENAMFLQQDLRLTTSQLNEYMKKEITTQLQEEFANYEESITDAKQLAISSIEKTQTAIDEQRQTMSNQLKKELDTEKLRIMERFNHNLGEIVNHYILEAIGDQIDLNDQLEYIISDLENNKKAIIEDIKNGT